LHNVWTGVTSTDWFTTSNWSDGQLPSFVTCPDVLIPQVPSGFYPIITIGTAVVNNIIINANASVTINNTGAMQISGSITNSGTFDVTAGAVEFNGTAAQSIPADVFYTNKIKDLIITNNVTLNGQDSLTGTLSFGSTGKTFTTNGLLTLKSTASATGIVGQIINGNTINGDVIVERYFSAKRAWRFLAVPTNTTQNFHQAWQENMPQGSTTQTNPPGYGTQVTHHLVPTVANGFDYDSPDGPSVKKYNPSAGGTYAPYVGISTTFELMATREGLMTFVRGDRRSAGLGATPYPTVLRTKGGLITGNQNYAVNAGAFTSIGNPYAAPLDMRQIAKTSTEFFYLWDPALGGSNGLGAFQTFSIGAGGNYYPTPGGGSYPAGGTPYNYIHSGLAFFVQGDTGPGSLSITENSKAASASAGNLSLYRPLSDKTTQIRTNLYAIGADGSTSLVDGTLDQFADNYNNAIDKIDAKKMPNVSENLSIKVDNQLLAIERRNTVTVDDTIQLNMLKMKVKSYRFELIGQNFGPTVTAFIEDSRTNSRRQIDLNGTTTYDFSVVNEPSSWNPTRFRIVLKQSAQGPLPITLRYVKAYPLNSDISVDWEISDEKNIQYYEVEKSTDGRQFTSAATVDAKNNNSAVTNYRWLDTKPVAGVYYYRIKSVNVSGEIEYSDVVKVIVSKGRPEIKVYPNPVTNGKINMQFINLPTGKYEARIVNTLGQVMFMKQINHDERTNIEVIKLNRNVVDGAYRLEVTLPDKNKIGTNLFLQ
jgi:hypothetical protein